MNKIIDAAPIIASASIGSREGNDFTSGALALSSAITKTAKNPVERNTLHPDVIQFAKELPSLNSDQSIPQQEFTQRSKKLINWIGKNQQEIAMAICKSTASKIIFDNKVNQGETIFYGLYNEKGFEFK